MQLRAPLMEFLNETAKICTDGPRIDALVVVHHLYRQHGEEISKARKLVVVQGSRDRFLDSFLGNGIRDRLFRNLKTEISGCPPKAFRTSFRLAPRSSLSAASLISSNRANTRAILRSAACLDRL